MCHAHKTTTFLSVLPGVVKVAHKTLMKLTPGMDYLARGCEGDPRRCCRPCGRGRPLCSWCTRRA